MTHRWTGRVCSAVFATVVALVLAVDPSTASAAYRDTVAATPGLVSHWRLGELGGVTATDQQGTNSGSYMNSPALGTTGLLTADSDAAVGFDGVNDAVKVPNAVSLAVSSSLTVETWVKRSSTASPQTLFDKGHYFANILSSGRVQFGVYTSGGWVQLVSPSNSIASGTTYHLAFTWDGAVLRIHKNGVEIGSKAATGTLPLGTSYDLIIGADSNGYDPIGEYFAGTIDEVAVYSRALGLGEVRQHYAEGVADLTPPETTITGGPTGTTPATHATFQLASSEAGSSYECRLDGGTWASCGPTRVYTALADGEHTFEARAIDAAFNTDPTPSTRTWTVERSPYALAVAQTADLVAHWRFSENSGAGAYDEKNVAHATYVGSPALPSAGLIVDDPNTAFTADGSNDHARVSNTHPHLVPATGLSWEFWLKPSSLGCGATLVDKNIYEVSFGCNGELRFHLEPGGSGTDLLSPTNAFAAGETYYVALTWDGATMRMYMNGAEIASKTASGTLANPAYYLFFGAASTPATGYTPTGGYFAGTMDEAALYSRALTASEVRERYRVGLADSSPPDTSITSGPTGPTQSADASFEFTSDETGSTFECRLDGGAWSTCSSPKTYSGLASGSHTFEVRATDTAFNVDPTPASRSWTYASETTPPETTIASGPSGTTESAVATFEFTSSEPGSAFECQLDGGAWTACSSPRTYSELANGQHTFDVRASDAAGNTDPTSASRTWTVTVPDPNDYWKGTLLRRQTVYRLIYSQSPQTIPPSYDPVAEAEQILRDAQRTAPPSEPASKSLWQQIRGVAVKSALSSPLRALGTISLGVDTFRLGWKIGEGINAKFLNIGIPGNGPIPASYSSPQLRFRQAGERSQLWFKVPIPEDGWVWSIHSEGYGWQRSMEYRPTVAGGGCQEQAFTPPADFIEVTAPAQEYACAPQGYTPVNDLKIAYIPEDALAAEGPIEPYTGQLYDRSSAAPPAPDQTTVEQTIENELEKPENSLLRDWLNYMLGLPGARDPIGEGVNVPQPAEAPGAPTEVFVEELEELGLGNVTFRVLSDPDADPAFDEGAVVRVSPPPGTSVQPGEEIVVTANRTAIRPNNGECDRAPYTDPDPAGVHGPFDPFGPQTMAAYNPGSGTVEDVPFRYGSPLDNWGYRHISIEHGWDNGQDRVDTTLALADPAPEANTPFANAYRYYHFYLHGQAKLPCTRRVVVQFGQVGTETETRGIITSFAYPGWYRKNDS